MTAAFARRPRTGLTIPWRTIEWWGAGIALFLETGALFPLLMSGAEGDLGDPAKSKLRLLSLPVYAFAGLMLIRHRRDFFIALNRNLQFQLLLAMPFVSVLWSVGPSTTLRRAIGLLFTVLLAYVLAIRFTPRQLLLLVMATFGACIVLSLLLLGAAPRLARMPSDGTLRGVFLHKNSLGWYASILVVVAAIVVIDGRLGFRRTAIALLVAGLACLAGSTSMTAILSTASASCAIWVYSMLPKLRGVARVVFVLILIQLTAVLLFALGEYLVPLLEALGKDATLTGRVPLWQLVDVEISEHLLLGFGYQAFWTAANPEAWTIWSAIGWEAPHSHNGFRDILLSFGILGPIVFTLVMVRAIHAGAALQCRAPEDGWLWQNVFIIMVLVMNLTESILLIQNDAIFTLFMTAIIMFSYYAPVYAAEAEPGGAARAKWRGSRAALAPAGGPVR